MAAIYFNLIYGMLARMGNTCTTAHSFLYLKTISIFWNLGSTCTPLNSDLGFIKHKVIIILFNLWTAG